MSQDENKKLSNYSYEYFITLTPDKNGMTQSAKKNCCRIQALFQQWNIL